MGCVSLPRKKRHYQLIVIRSSLIPFGRNSRIAAAICQRLWAYPLIPILLSLNLANPACGCFTGSTVLPARPIRCAPSAIIAVKYAGLEL